MKLIAIKENLYNSCDGCLFQHKDYNRVNI